MIKRLFWLAAGAAIGVVAIRKVAAMKSAVGPEGLNRAVGRLTDTVADFADAMREGMHERENDLRAALGIDSEPRS
ncbi:hypothetical protein GC088_08120 [Arthrobacter sp. JZ12]|uniref:hypothetical protein n=1 Tax=Arthrobacter sp. JZ12 TaxID=2654190 RepID=UPI002B489186|nr:hypothetical protein [Arthrobacter sp. JZ12]WRH25040.1 hypothetical protein GC088_08120 [Arthrobacter sp. JZ12]